MSRGIIIPSSEVAAGHPEQLDIDNQWYGSVAESIEGHTGIQMVVADLPHPSDAGYSDYEELIHQSGVNDAELIVAHGFGAGLAMRYLSEHPEVRPDKVALVAPQYLRTGEGARYFFESPDRRLVERVGKAVLMYCADTSVNGLRSADRIMHHLGRGIEVRQLQGMGKCLVGNSMKTADFPELLEAVIELKNGEGEAPDNVISIGEARGARRPAQRYSVG